MKKCLVLLSTYNGEKYLEKLLCSVLKQNGLSVDILVRDDGSSDGTTDILIHYAKLGKLSWYSGKNLKPERSFIDLIFSAKKDYDYYALCDQDDVWADKKLYAAMKILETFQQKEPALYSSAVERVDRDLNHIEISYNNNTYESPLFNILMYGTPGCTFVFNNALHQKLCKYRPTYLSMHDSWISFVCLATGGNFYTDRNTYIKYRQHGENVLGSQPKPILKTIEFIIFNKKRLRSEMCKELLIGYSTEMSEEIKAAFDIFAHYKESLNHKIKLLIVNYIPGYDSIRAFYKMKLRILFNSI